MAIRGPKFEQFKQDVDCFDLMGACADERVTLLRAEDRPVRGGRWSGNTKGEAVMGESGNQPPRDTAETVLSALLAQDAELWTTSEAFVRTLPARAEALMDALRSGSYERIRDVAHHLKAAGAHCGQRTLCEKAALVEQAAHDHAVDGLALRVHDLTALIGRIHVELRREDA